VRASARFAEVRAAGEGMNVTGEYTFDTKYKDPPNQSWQSIDRFVIIKAGYNNGYWPASIVTQRLHNWLVAYFYNIKKGVQPSK
jgi:hypothetical protein